MYFYAQKNSSYGAQGPIPFETAVVNTGDALDLKTGVFTAPVPGVYFFSFDAYSDSHEGRVHLQKNGVTVGQSYDYDHGYLSQLHLASILQLDAGDEIQVNVHSGQIYEDANGHNTHFAGMLLNDDVFDNLKHMSSLPGTWRMNVRSKFIWKLRLAFNWFVTQSNEINSGKKNTWVLLSYAVQRQAAYLRNKKHPPFPPRTQNEKSQHFYFPSNGVWTAKRFLDVGLWWNFPLRIDHSKPTGVSKVTSQSYGGIFFTVGIPALRTDNRGRVIRLLARYRDM